MNRVRHCDTQVKQSMTSGCMDCRAGRHCEEHSDAAIAVTKTLFMILVRYRFCNFASVYFLSSAHLDSAGVVKACSPGTLATVL